MQSLSNADVDGAIKCFFNINITAFHGGRQLLGTAWGHQMWSQMRLPVWRVTPSTMNKNEWKQRTPLDGKDTFRGVPSDRGLYFQHLLHGFTRHCLVWLASAGMSPPILSTSMNCSPQLQYTALSFSALAKSCLSRTALWFSEFSADQRENPETCSVRHFFAADSRCAELTSTFSFNSAEFQVFDKRSFSKCISQTWSVVWSWHSFLCISRRERLRCVSLRQKISYYLATALLRLCTGEQDIFCASNIFQ